MRLQKPSRLGCGDAFDALAIAFAHCEHFALVRARNHLIAITAAHVRHVDAQNIEELFSVASGYFAQCIQEAADVLILLRFASGVDAFRERSRTRSAKS